MHNLMFAKEVEIEMKPVGWPRAEHLDPNSSNFLLKI